MSKIVVGKEEHISFRGIVDKNMCIHIPLAYLPNKNPHAGKQLLQFRRYRCHIVQAKSNISTK